VGARSTLRYRCERLSYVACPWARICRVGQVYTPIRMVTGVDAYIIMVYLLYSYACYLECSSFLFHLYSCIIYMAKIIKVKY
jgi:hypothetical protein